MPDDMIFNHEIFVDLMWIEKLPHAPFLHIVDHGTRFSAATFVRSENSIDAWNAFVTCWEAVYFSFPNALTLYQGKYVTSDFFPDSFVKFGIILKDKPTESHNSLGPS